MEIIGAFAGGVLVGVIVMFFVGRNNRARINKLYDQADYLSGWVESLQDRVEDIVEEAKKNGS